MRMVFTIDHGLLSGLDDTQRSELLSWWVKLTAPNREELTELTRDCNMPWIFKRLTLLEDNLGDDLINDLYDYLINHEAKGFLPFFSTVSRDGYWGTFRHVVLASP